MEFLSIMSLTACILNAIKTRKFQEKGPQDDYEFFGLVLVSTVNSCSTFHSLFLQDLSVNCWFTMRFPLFQEQIAACHEFDGVRKEKERLTAAYWSRELQLHLTDLFFTGISFTFGIQKTYESFLRA